MAAFTVADDDEIMLVTNAGQLIRCPVHDIRIAGRNTQGVTLFKTSDDEQVVSVAHLVGTEDDGDDEEDNDDDSNAENVDVNSENDTE